MLSRVSQRFILSNISKFDHFSIENIPFGAGTPDLSKPNRCVSRIGDHVIDLSALESRGFFSSILKQPTFSHPTLNTFMEQDPPTWSQVRNHLQEGIIKSSPDIQASLSPVSSFTSALPAKVTEFTDFYSCKNHRDNCGKMFPIAITPNYEYVPLAYHSRVSSVKLSGVPVRRPKGQIVNPEGDLPLFRPSSWFDYEFEMGYFLGGKGNELGTSLQVDTADSMIFGFVILVDWSSRDIQMVETKPLGPFASKNFMTTISAWVVTRDALKPFEEPMMPMEIEPVKYLQHKDRKIPNIKLETHYKTENMQDFEVVSRSNLNNLYWSFGQQLAHHTVTGCNMEAANLIGTGTISGTEDGTMGSMLELAYAGTKPITFSNGETRGFLGDGDTLKLVAYAQNDSFTVGFGETRTPIEGAN